MTSSTPRLAFASVAALLMMLLPAPAALAQSPGATPGMGPVAQQEKAIWDALQAGTYDTIPAHMTSKFVYVGEVIGDRAHTMDGMKSCKLASYTFHDAQTRQITPDIVLLTYVATVDQTCGPEPYKGDLNCSSLWQKQNGKWMGVSHTEAMAAKH